MQICIWSKEYGLTVNPNETQVIIVGSPTLQFKINFQLIPVVSCTGSVVSDKEKNLGIYMYNRYTGTYYTCRSLKFLEP